MPNISRILLTGGSGRLGDAIRKSGLFPNIFAPSRSEFDITNPATLSSFLLSKDVDAVIHCAAVSRIGIAEGNPSLAVLANIAGTANLVQAILGKERRSGKSIRFIYISTDNVYPGTRGNYQENDSTVPYNTYGWTKLGGECAVRCLKNHCIIRTSFFAPEAIRFDDSPIDMYSSKLPIMDLAGAIHSLVHLPFVGVVNVGDKRRSEYERYKVHKLGIKPTTFEDVQKQTPFPLAKDASLDTSLWKSLTEKGIANTHKKKQAVEKLSNQQGQNRG